MFSCGQARNLLFAKRGSIEEGSEDEEQPQHSGFKQVGKVSRRGLKSLKKEKTVLFAEEIWRT